MTKKAFIQSNNRQFFGATLAKFAIKRNYPDLEVEIINVDTLPQFQSFEGVKYLFNDTEKRIYKLSDLQSFTLSRFMPPELMAFSGRAIVIDPDIFALSNIEELFKFDMEDTSILACRKKSAWDSSVMVLNCEKLTHWKISEILQDLKDRKITYSVIMSLKKEIGVKELSRVWNDLDNLTSETKMLHTTERLTQPWSTGLKVDFTRNKMPKYFGIIPRELIHKIFGKYPNYYQPHPNKNIEKFFFELVKDAVMARVITKEDIEREIEKKNVRPDLLELII